MKKFLKTILQVFAGINFLASFLLILTFMVPMITANNTWLISFANETKSVAFYGGLFEFKDSMFALQGSVIWFGVAYVFFSLVLFLTWNNSKSNLIEITTRLNKKIKVNISKKFCKSYGVKYKDLVRFSNGDMAIVLGVGQDSKGNNQLWLVFLDDGGKASYWVGWENSESMKKYEIEILK